MRDRRGIGALLPERRARFPRRRRAVVWTGLLLALAGSVAILVVQKRRTDEDLRRLIRTAALKHELDPHLVEAVVRAESGGNARAVSRKQAYGLMQLRVPTASDMARKPVAADDLFEPRLNLELGCRYLKYLLRRYDGDVALALMAYNAGLGNVDRWRKRAATTEEVLTRHAFRQTRAYVAKVRRYRRTLASG